MTAEELLREWDERDRAASWVPSDERVWRDVGALRLLCVELLLAAPHSGSDLYHACIRLGGTLSDRGATPTLAAVALDGAREAFAAKGRVVPDLTWRAARAALVEGYVRHSREEVERQSFESWEPPRCLVVIGPDQAAVVACHPSTDADLLTAWAGRVAGALLVRGVRRAIVGGSSEATAAVSVLQALSDAGIVATLAPPPKRKI